MKNPLVFATVTYNRKRIELSDIPYFILTIHPYNDELYYEALLLNAQRQAVFVHEIEVDSDLDTVIRMIDSNGEVALYSTPDACAKYVELVNTAWES